MKNYQVYLSPSDVKALEAGSSTCVAQVKPNQNYRPARLVLDCEIETVTEGAYLEEVNRHENTRLLVKAKQEYINELNKEIEKLKAENEALKNKPAELQEKPRHKMVNLVDWLHNSCRGDDLEIVKITDLTTTILGLKDTKSKEVFVVGNLHDLTFTLKGND